MNKENPQEIYRDPEADAKKRFLEYVEGIDMQTRDDEQTEDKEIAMGHIEEAIRDSKQWRTLFSELILEKTILVTPEVLDAIREGALEWKHNISEGNASDTKLDNRLNHYLKSLLDFLETKEE